MKFLKEQMFLAEANQGLTRPELLDSKLDSTSEKISHSLVDPTHTTYSL